MEGRFWKAIVQPHTPLERKAREGSGGSPVALSVAVMTSLGSVLAGHPVVW